MKKQLIDDSERLFALRALPPKAQVPPVEARLDGIVLNLGRGVERDALSSPMCRKHGNPFQLLQRHVQLTQACGMIDRLENSCDTAAKSCKMPVGDKDWLCC